MLFLDPLADSPLPTSFGSTPRARSAADLVLVRLRAHEHDLRSYWIRGVRTPSFSGTSAACLLLHSSRAAPSPRRSTVRRLTNTPPTTRDAGSNSRGCYVWRLDEGLAVRFRRRVVLARTPAQFTTPVPSSAETKSSPTMTSRSPCGTAPSPAAGGSARPRGAATCAPLRPTGSQSAPKARARAPPHSTVQRARSSAQLHVLGVGSRRAPF